MSKSFALPLENFQMQKLGCYNVAVKLLESDEACGMGSCEIRHCVCHVHRSVLLEENSVCCDAVLAHEENLLSAFLLPRCPQV